MRETCVGDQDQDNPPSLGGPDARNAPAAGVA
jgi:hypothetical protein